MAKIDISAIASQMVAAAKKEFGDKWPDARLYAQTEFQKIAHSIALIEELRVSGTINEQEARLQLDIQKNATRSILCAIEGLGLLAVEAAINAALKVIQTAVNTALGFALL